MIVVVTVGVPAGLRGDITRWLAEIAPGVYVGNVSRRVRDELWERVRGQVGPGGALLVVPARNEQGYEVLTHNYSWELADFDGLIFLRRPNKGSPEQTQRRKWSKARGRLAARRRNT